MKRSCNYTSLTSIARTVKGLLNFYLSRKQMPFLKERKQKAQLARNCLKCNSWVSKLNNFLGVAHHTPRGCPPPTPTPTWHCKPRWQPRHHFWSLLLPYLSWLFQTLTKTLTCFGISYLWNVYGAEVLPCIFCNYGNYSCTIITTALGGSLHFGTDL